MRLIGFYGFLIGFIIGGVMMARSHGTLFRSWTETSYLYHGDKVEYRYNDDFYSKCKDMTVLDMQTVDSATLVWVLIHKCGIGDLDDIAETFLRENLIKVSK